MSDAAILNRLYEIIEQRKHSATAEKSYVKSLMDQGVPKITAKITEEADEVIQAAAQSDSNHLTHEIADLVFHLWVLMSQQGIKPTDIYAELERRFGTGGHDEKASRPSGEAP